MQAIIHIEIYHCEKKSIKNHSVTFMSAIYYGILHGYVLMIGKSNIFSCFFFQLSQKFDLYSG